MRIRVPQMFPVAASWTQRSGSMSRWALVLMLGVGALATTACGGRQSVDGGSCPRVREGMAPADQQRWATCVERNAPVATDSCREALGWSRGLTPVALEAAVRCVLSSGDRADGGAVASVFEGLAADRERAQAAARGLSPHFSAAVHGNTFAGTLSTTGERALGGALGVMEPAARDEVLDLALAQGLHTLVELGLPWLRARDEAPEAIAQYVQQLRDDQPLSEADRWALAASGRWTAEQIVACSERRVRGCTNWQGENPLALLPADRSTSRPATTTARVMDQIGTAGADAAAVSGILGWISQPGTANRDGMLHAMIGNMLSDGVDRQVRMNIARSATPELCATDQLLARATRAGAESVSNGDGVWATFVRGCAERHWAANELLVAVSLGSVLAVPAQLEQELRARLAERAQGVECSALEALGELVVTTQSSRNPLTGRLWVELARASSGCADRFTAAIRGVAGTSGAHPEARLAAIAWLAQRGDRSRCGDISAASSWDRDRSGVPLGARHADLVQQAQAACR